MIPVIELRGAIPWGLFVYHFPVIQTYILCVIGSIIPAPFILLFVQGFINLLHRFRLTEGFANWLDKKAEKGSVKVARYKFWGLMIFVAIPLPGTGVWTGCLIASFMEMNFFRALISVILGSMIAGLLVIILCQLGVIVAT